MPRTACMHANIRLMMGESIRHKIEQQLELYRSQDYSPAPWQRFYLGYRERFVDDCIIEMNDKVVLRLAQAASTKDSAKKTGLKHNKSSLGKDASDPALTGELQSTIPKCQGLISMP
jgi:hypothetical protein